MRPRSRHTARGPGHTTLSSHAAPPPPWGAAVCRQHRRHSKQSTQKYHWACLMAEASPTLVTAAPPWRRGPRPVGPYDQVALMGETSCSAIGDRGGELAGPVPRARGATPAAQLFGAFVSAQESVVQVGEGGEEGAHLPAVRRAELLVDLGVYRVAGRLWGVVHCVVPHPSSPRVGTVLEIVRASERLAHEESRWAPSPHQSRVGCVWAVGTPRPRRTRSATARVCAAQRAIGVICRIRESTLVRLRASLFSSSFGVCPRNGTVAPRAQRART